MDKLKKARRPLRAQQTKLLNECRTAIDGVSPDEDDLRANLNTLELINVALEELNEKITTQMLDDNTPDGDMDTEYDQINQYRKSYFIMKQKLEKIINKPNSPPASEYESAASVSGQKKSFKLPKITLKTFSGDLKDWLSWWSQFQKIDEDEELHESDKFQYLLQAMVEGSKARDVVVSYPQTAVNYPKAVQALKERFGKTELLVEVYVRELLSLIIQNVRCKDQFTLSNIYDRLESHLRSLESLGITSDKYDAILYPMVESCLSIPVMRAWQRSTFSRTDGTGKTRLETLMEFLHSEVESELRISLACEGFGLQTELEPKGKKGPENKSRLKMEEDYPATAAGLVNEEIRRSKCVFCGNNHKSHECGKAQDMSLQNKKELLQKGKCCFLCFRPNHVSANCRSFVKCVICGGKHQPLLCPDLPTHVGKTNDEERLEDASDGSTTTVSCSNHASNEVMLQTIVAKLKFGNQEKSVRVLFDSGSQRSHILKSTAEELGLKHLTKETITHILFGGFQARNVEHKKYTVVLEKADSRFKCQLEVLDQEQICGILPSVDPGPWMNSLKQNSIWLSDVGKGNHPIEVLIGADFYGQLQTGRVKQLPSGLTAVETKLGWTVMGPYRHPNGSSTSSMVVTCMNINEMAVPDLWRLETIGIRDPVELATQNERDKLLQEDFNRKIKRDNDGRYEVMLPWSNGTQNIPDNRAVAEKRLLSTTKRLHSIGKYNDYQRVFTEWLNEDIIETVGETAVPAHCHYLPHRPVFKEESLTTKVRPVFDASCKTGRAPSLNDCLEKGPNLIDLIPSVMHRFRREAIGVISDIRKAFLMISVTEADRDYLRFLWWEPSTSSCNERPSKVKVYRHKRVVFGVNCSPFLLGAVIRYHLGAYTGSKGEVAKKLQQSLYVDNCVASVSTAEDLRNFRKLSVDIMEEAKMELRMWQDSYNVQEDMEDRVVSVLGMKWDRYLDTLFCHIGQCEDFEGNVTKRKILSFTQRIFDPLGIVSPVTLCTKLLLQETWAQKRGWDDKLDEQISARFMDWMSQLPLLSSLSIPRCFTGGNLNRLTWSLHTFCDGSGYAYAAVTFLRCERTNGTAVVQLIQAKARVAPKKTSIPRMELLACTIGSRLANVICETLELENIPRIFWSDSTTALAWIKRNDDWGTFVGNRVREIVRLSSPSNWRHVPGKHNPADLPSRGCSAKQLLKERWWEGPKWLQDTPSTWPLERTEVDEEAVYTERKKTVTSASNVTMENPWYMTSGYTRILKKAAYVFRLLNKIMKKSPQFCGLLTPEEMEVTELRLVKIIQAEMFSSGSSFKTLDVIKDDEDILRVKTRIIMRDDAFNFRFPILLPKKHPFTTEIILEEHLKTCHGGVQFLMSRLREKFWILQARTAISSVIHKCVRCQRFTSKSVQLTPAPLPANRIDDATAFEVVGVDLAGPLFLKEKKKVWIVLYTCAIYRAVHLELVTSLDTDHFLQSFRRFVARRGRPRVVYSDNGTNFRGSVNLFRALDWKAISDKYLVEQIKWIFNPPSAAWWGGFWERLVRTVKGLLLRVLGKSSVCYEELLTILCEVESVINQRPLTYVTEDGKDLIPLTPAMFLQGMKNVGLPEVDVIDHDGYRGRFRYRQQLLDELTSRFRKEYLGVLVQKAKDEKQILLKVGDIVLVGHDFKKRMEWPLGRILELYEGRDGQNRVAKVKTQHGELVRPVQRLFPLEVGSEESFTFQEKAEKVQEGIPAKTSTFGRLIKKPDRLGYE